MGCELEVLWGFEERNLPMDSSTEFRGSEVNSVAHGRSNLRSRLLIQLIPMEPGGDSYIQLNEYTYIHI